MKKIVSIMLFLIASYDGFTQRTQIIDSLRHELVLAKDDTIKVLIKSELSFMLSFINPDSSIIYAQDALALARQINYYKGQIRALISLGRGYANIGDMSKALELEFKGLQIAKEKNYTQEIALSFLEIANIYQYFDLLKSIDYLNQAKLINESDQNNKEYEYLENRISLNIGIRYMQKNQLDSALIYLQSTYNRTVTSAFFHPPLLLFFGQLQFKLGNQATAINYLRQSIEINDQNKDYHTGAEAYAVLAGFYLKLNQPDSAIWFFKKGLEQAQSINYKNSILQISSQLTNLYETRDLKEAHKYLKIANTLSEELYGPEKLRGLQKLISEEQERQRKIEAENLAYQNRLRMNTFLGSTFTLLVIAIFLFIIYRRKQKAKQKIESAFNLLKSTQAQLIQSEKMASLGELTAGIAHEIQNPLNFVNNFSEVSNELIAEVEEERAKNPESRDENLVSEILTDVKQNLEKINHHGKRAADIVKGMLQHSRTSSGVKEPTDINALADEYLRLAYHGLRAKDKSFNADFKTEFDETLPKINVIPQDIGRVLLNLINNAFYAVSERSKKGEPGFAPTVTVTTQQTANSHLLVAVKDNGPGIPPLIVDKIFQPFFTTKPTGSGTGLGLSLSYDIVKAHGGELKVEKKEGEGSTFIIQIPTG